MRVRIKSPTYLLVDRTRFAQLLRRNSEGAFRSVSFGAVVLKQGAFPPKDRLVWTDVNSAIALGCGTKQAGRDHLEEEVSAHCDVQIVQRIRARLRLRFLVAARLLLSLLQSDIILILGRTGCFPRLQNTETTETHRNKHTR